MKTWIIVFIVLIGVSVGLMFGVYKMFDSAGEHETAGSTEKKVNKVEEFKEQTKKVGGVTYDLALSPTPDEIDVINVMHNMTHQKVKADDKWGAIPMMPETINEIYEIISKSDFPRKEDLLAIADRWKNGDFSRADDDHNYFWNYKNGTIGEAYGLMSEAEEKRFILNNFGEEYLPE